jgi:hypothetical protein
MMEDTAKKLCKLFEDAKGLRQLKDTQLKFVSKYVMPNRGDFGTSSSLASGGVFDTTAVEALKNLAAVLTAGLTPPMLKWLNGRIENKYIASQPEVKAWVNSVELHLLDRVFNNPHSGFAQQNHQFLKDLAGYGTSCMFAERVNDIIIFNAIHLQQVYFLEDHAGRPDTVFRRYDMTARQLEAKFGEENLPSRVQTQLKSRPNEKVECVHIVMPKKDYVRMGGDNTREMSVHDFVSTHLCLNEKHVMDVKGFYEMPYIIARWDKRTDEIYGIGPGIDALPNIFASNKLAKTLIEVAEKMGNPPIFMNDDSVARPLNLNAGGVNFVEFDQNGRPMVQPFDLRARPGDLDALLKGFQTAIRAAFFTDRMEQKEGTPVSATEILDNQQIRLSLTGPHINRIETEYLAPMVERAFYLEMRAGNLPPIPEILNGHTIRFEFASPLSKLQRSQELMAANKFLGATQVIWQSHPDALDVIKSDESLTYFADLAGYPQQLIRSDQEIAAVRQARAEQQQMQQVLSAGTDASGIIKNLSQADALSRQASE